MGAGPVLSEGFDVQMVPDGDGYIVEAGTKAGETMMKDHAKWFA